MLPQASGLFLLPAIGVQVLVRLCLMSAHVMGCAHHRPLAQQLSCQRRPHSQLLLCALCLPVQGNAHSQMSSFPALGFSEDAALPSFKELRSWVVQPSMGAVAPADATA